MNEPQEHIDLHQVLLNAQQHPIRTESVINVSEMPTHAKEQIESRTRMWAVQNQNYFQNEYVAFAAYSALQGSLQLLHEEIELSLNDIWRAKHIVLWEGIKQGLQSTEKNHPMTELKKNYKKILQRANAYHFDPERDKLTLEVDAENAAMALYLDRCNKLTPEQALVWLTHRVMLAPSVSQANDAIKYYHAECLDRLVSRIPDFTPQSLQMSKQLGLNGLHKQLKGFEKPNLDKPRDIRISTIPDELYNTLDAGGAFDVKPATPSDSSISSPTELIQAIAKKHKVEVLSMEEWRAKSTREKCVLVRHFDFRSVKKSSLGRAQYLLIGPTSDFDVRIELKSQTQSGSAGDKLPMHIFRLQNMQNINAYNKTVIGIVDSTHFADDTLAFAAKIAKLYAKVEFKVDDELRTTLHHTVEQMVNLFEKIKKGLVNPQKTVIDVLGLADPIIPKNKTSLEQQEVATGISHKLGTNTPSFIGSDDEFGLT